MYVYMNIIWKLLKLMSILPKAVKQLNSRSRGLYVESVLPHLCILQRGRSQAISFISITGSTIEGLA